ncbi:hypothetical protein YC2023_063240 [Brassica napus]
MTLREDKRNMMQRTYSEDLLDSIEYNSTKYLRDLDHIRERLIKSTGRLNLIFGVRVPVRVPVRVYLSFRFSGLKISTSFGYF